METEENGIIPKSDSQVAMSFNPNDSFPMVLSTPMGNRLERIEEEEMTQNPFHSNLTQNQEFQQQNALPNQQDRNLDDSQIIPLSGIETVKMSVNSEGKKYESKIQ